MAKTAKQMGSFKTLEDIGLREISRKTYIELNYLKLMADKDFAKLPRVKTLGFVKIIQREYGIDLSEWVKEFEEYLSSDKASQPVRHEADEVLVEHKKISKRKKFYIIFSIIALVLVMAFLYAFTKGRTGHIEDVSANIEKYDELNQSLMMSEEQNSNQNSTENSTNVTAALDENASANISVESAANLSEPVIEPALSTAAPSRPLSVHDIPNSKTPKAIIEPHAALWVGMVDLGNNYTKRSYIREGNIPIDLSREQIIITGHGDFALKNGDSKRLFKPSQRVYLHVKNGTISEINENDFTNLNRGQTW